jgi:EAL domain-containing protein (putative c-di-GMP-specific phosphodiesterase class I)/GGDEF domain-containing protein
MAHQGDMIGLVELADADSLLDRHGRASFKELQDIFHKRLQNWVRTKDEWQRLDDDRFCVVLKGITSRGELELAAAKLERLFKEPHIQFGRPVNLEFNAGFTQVKKPQQNMDTSLREANIALRQARKTSRSYDLYTPQKRISADQERQMVRNLERAIELGELELFYQPKVHSQYHSLIGAEALIRWITADKKIVPPNEFIDVAERNEVIRPMTWWVIKSAVSRLARWPEEISIAVNVTPNLLLDDQILSVVKDSLDIYGINPARLTLEVTERVMVDDQQVMLRQLGRLREFGVKISLDDFGTGFSSLSYFRDLPVDEIKIDQGFVFRMLESEKDYAIVKAVIDLAHNFDLRVVAEGVESLDIAGRLAELGCDVLQGYVFDKPLQVEEFEAGYGIRSSKSSLAHSSKTKAAQLKRAH